MSVLREVVAMTTQGFSRSGRLLQPSQLLSGCVCGHDCHAGSSDSEGTGTAPLRMQPRPHVLGGVSPACQWGRGFSSLDVSHTGLPPAKTGGAFATSSSPSSGRSTSRAFSLASRALLLGHPSTFQTTELSPSVLGSINTSTLAASNLGVSALYLVLFELSQCLVYSFAVKLVDIKK